MRSPQLRHSQLAGATTLGDATRELNRRRVPGLGATLNRPRKDKDVNRKIAAVLVVGVTAMCAGEAYADTSSFPTRFTEFKLERSSGKRTFSGQIDSTNSGCLKGRKVELIGKHSGNQTTLGKDMTNGDGKFKVALPGSEVKDGTYYAKAKQKKFNNGDKCVEGQSGTIKVSS
jgi:5-hydroxyisourate hydrolase-like protein (transthyretin family)